MNGSRSRICQLSVITLLLACQVEAHAWSRPQDPVAIKYNTDQYVYRPDVRFDRPAHNQYDSPKLTQEQDNKWVWNANQDKRVDYRPWGNYDFSKPGQQNYYAPEYQQAAAQYQYPITTVYQVAEPVYRVNPYASYTVVQSYKPQAQYVSGYDNRYYQSGAYPVSAQRTAQNLSVTDPSYAYNPVTYEQAGMDYYVAPYAYELY